MVNMQFVLTYFSIVLKIAAYLYLIWVHAMKKLYKLVNQKPTYICKWKSKVLTRKENLSKLCTIKFVLLNNFLKKKLLLVKSTRNISFENFGKLSRELTFCNKKHLHPFNITAMPPIHLF